jgi:hypothetical protein
MDNLRILGFIFILAIIVLIIIALAKGFQSNLKGNKFRIEKAKDKGANRLFTDIEFFPDKLVIDNSEYILFSNIIKAYVDNRIQDIRIVNSLIYGGKRYKQGMVYSLHIDYKSKYGSVSSLNFGSLDYLEFTRYKLIADRINSIIGYTEEKQDNEMRKL